MRGGDARQHGAGRGEPRLIVLSQARWSGNDGGENCLFWAPVRRCVAVDGAAWAHAKYVFKKRRDMPRVRDGNVFLRFQFTCLPWPSMCRWLCSSCAHRTGRGRRRPQRRTARLRLDQVRGLQIQSGPRTGSFQEQRPSSPSGCLATFDVAVSRTLPGRFGRSPYFRHQRLLRRSLRPRGGTRQINSLYQCSVTGGAAPDRTCLWAPSLPEW